MTETLPLDRIVVGERDRLDAGDIAELAKSIAAVGLLHPVVVTAADALVAGQRRLAAVARLGWAEVPVTVVDLDTAAEVLRAEQDENTCRKDLTPYEASRARERRAAVLAPQAAERKGGRPSKDAEETGSRRDPVSGRTRQIAAQGTGYGGTTLDRVDKIRDVAERGITRVNGEERTAPDEVREIAQEVLHDLQRPGAKVQPAVDRVEQAFHDYLEDDQDLRRARLVQAWWKALKHTSGWRSFDLSVLPDILSPDDWEASDMLVRGLEMHIEAYRKTKPAGLRAVKGTGT